MKACLRFICLLIMTITLSNCSLVLNKIIPGISDLETTDKKHKILAHSSTDHVTHTARTVETSSNVIDDLDLENDYSTSLPEASSTINNDYTPSPVCRGDKVTKHWHDLKKVVVIIDGLNIRNHYGLNQAIIAKANRCDKLTVLDKRIEKLSGNKRYRSRGWLKIKTQNGTTGWVASWYTQYVD
ncbi:MAG: hypothetical protein OMM_02221 [Candidatus Magnetoglobus multicellularis str. Araruama]|uniref:SH3b domain-containing protein n=1 Tax=Candidatus Magnetoglobus multicellularis str. Araruama TaxID=890399 RepID=A0A1V1PAK6_9BACT|nr:MAG: hypothetical protein OMM_02221 [Candidatus Magnetoglobus multicellularis str. Araruama]